MGSYELAGSSPILATIWPNGHFHTAMDSSSQNRLQRMGVVIRTVRPTAPDGLTEMILEMLGKVNDECLALGRKVGSEGASALSIKERLAVPPLAPSRIPFSRR